MHNFQRITLHFLIDPSGYVYDDETGERLENVTVTAYCIEYDESEDFWTNVPSANEYGRKWDAGFLRVGILCQRVRRGKFGGNVRECGGIREESH